MKNFTHRVVLVLMVIGLVTFNVTQVRTKPAAPPAGGVSGDPQRSTCAFVGCHPGPELSFPTGGYDLNMGITAGNLSAIAGQAYTPGQTYFFEFKPNVTNGSNTRYGFQMTALDPVPNMAGAFTITDAVHNSAQSLLSRNYIGHKDASSFHDWNFQWTAPATNAGKITLYFAVCDADGNGSESNDKIYKGTVELLPSTGTGIGVLSESITEIKFFPNPVKEHLYICFEKKDENAVLLNIF
jgi:hypothetical protein